MTGALDRSLSDVLNLQSTTGPRVKLDVDRVISAIFNRHKGSFLFVFKQNLRKTNMQIAELASLLHIYCSLASTDTFSRLSLQLIELEEAAEFIRSLADFRGEFGLKDIDQVEAELETFFSNKIILTCRYGTAIVLIPNHLRIDLGRICADSGYIHSCGDLVFSISTSSLTKEYVRESISSTIKENYRFDTRFLLVPYCHEDFTLVDRDDSLFYEDGLDDIKIHISKLYLGDTPLYSFIDDLATEFSSEIYIAPIDYKSSRVEFGKRFPDKLMSTIWVIGDSGADFSTRFPTDRRFLLAYLQRFKNENPYHNYEENKPAWVSHTTLPHSLAGAMLNIIRPWLNAGQTAEICDPFAGSGTIFLEAQRLSGIQCHTSDKSALAERIIGDNVSFFNLTRTQLTEILSELAQYNPILPEISPTGSKNNSSSPNVILTRIVDVISEWKKSCGVDFLQLPEALVEQGLSIVGQNITHRIILYVALRATVRGKVDEDRESSSWIEIFYRELRRLIGQMTNHLKSDSIPIDGIGAIPTGRLVEGSYSAALVPPPPFIAQVDLFGSGQFTKSDIKDLRRDRFSAIVCDPPYGFNTETDIWEASRFSKMMIPSLVEALKLQGGQLVISAPRISYSGRTIPLFLRSDYLAREVIRYCWETDRECVRPAVILPRSFNKMIGPPYYWVAEKTLLRRVLHFWIRKR